MRDALWVNPNGSMTVVTVDDNGDRVPEPQPDPAPTTTPAPKAEPKKASPVSKRKPR